LNSLPPVNKSELESKHIAELHELAAEAGVERYRMLSRAELIGKLAGGDGTGGSRPKGERGGGSRGGRQRDRDRKPRQRREEPKRGEETRRETESVTPPPRQSASPERPKRKRRRRWGRRRKGLRVHDLLLPAAPGRQTIVYAEGREACTALLREVAAELSDARNGPDPIALLVDPTPEELADWKREAPQAEIVAAGKANHAEDALAQAQSRAEGGEAVVVLLDSLTRFAESFGGPDDARALLDAGAVTVVAALERQAYGL